MHAFNYWVAVRRFLEDISIPWDQQVAVMFQIVSALVLDVPEAAACLEKIQGVPPNVKLLLPFGPWGHIDHDDSQCQCLSSNRTGAYIHALSIDQSPRDSISSPLLSPPGMAAGKTLLCGEKNPGDSSALVSTEILSVRPGSVPFVSHRAGAYRRLLLATYERMKTGTLSACDWLTPVTRGACQVSPTVDAGGGGDGCRQLTRMCCLCAVGLGVSIIRCFVLGLDTCTFLVLVVWPRCLRSFTVLSDR